MHFSDSEKEKILAGTTFSASRSGGPGGQNVNKVSSRVTLRFPVAASPLFTGSQKQRLFSILKNRINNEGELIITAHSERTQWRNREKAQQKLFGLLEHALTPPKKRIRTKPSAASKIKRLENKKKQAQKKQLRKPPEK